MPRSPRSLLAVQVISQREVIAFVLRKCEVM
jgi:hypothetical protein